MTKKRKKSWDLAEMKRWCIIVSWLVVVALVLFFVARAALHSEQQERHEQVAAAQTLDLEQPGLPGNVKNTTVTYPGFTVYFNPSTHIPNCVVYELTAEESRGRIERHGSFTPDESVKGCPQPADYSTSGYDRGHMAPAGDMKWSEDAMAASFNMTNVCPQNHALNSGAWNDLEIKVREWAKHYGSIIVFTGPIIDDNPSKIGRKRVAVPTAFFKVLLTSKDGKRMAIAFVYPNKNCRDDMASYVVTVDEVERLTGIDFFGALPDDEENAIEGYSNFTAWEHY